MTTSSSPNLTPSSIARMAVRHPWISPIPKVQLIRPECSDKLQVRQSEPNNQAHSGLTVESSRIRLRRGSHVTTHTKLRFLRCSMKNGAVNPWLCQCEHSFHKLSILALPAHSFDHRAEGVNPREKGRDRKPANQAPISGLSPSAAESLTEPSSIYDCVINNECSLAGQP